MPLIKGKSKKAFKENVRAEMESGKPQKQSLAIAYAIKRRAKKMSKGGEISKSFTESTGTKGTWDKIKKAVGMADGGPVLDQSKVASFQKGFFGKKAHGGLLSPSKVIIAIKEKKMNEGGEVENCEFEPDEETYPDMENMEYDSLDEERPSLVEDKKSRVARILSKIKG